MNKKLLASSYMLTAITIALWLLVKTFINDFAEAPFGNITLYWFLSLFGPMFTFLLLCLGYVRVRRAMDKEKMEKEPGTLKPHVFTERFFYSAISEQESQIILSLLGRDIISAKNMTEEELASLRELNVIYRVFLQKGLNPDVITMSTRDLLEKLKTTPLM